ncbi:hypothetical protein CS060_07130, partial [Anoxybacillus flavithermus]
LGTPPAFVLSQDQTLHRKFISLAFTLLFCSVFKEHQAQDISYKSTLLLSTLFCKKNKMTWTIAIVIL